MDTLILIGGTILFMAVAALFGWLRGTNRSLVRLGFVAVSGIISYFSARPIAEKVAALLDAESYVKDTIGSEAAEFVSKSEALETLVKSIPAMLIGIIVFVLVFFLLQLIMYIVQAIAVIKIEKKKEGTGALVGLACGFLVFALLCSPIISVVSMACDAAAELPTEVLEETEIPQELISSLVCGPVTKFYAAIGSIIDDGLTSITINDKKMSLTSVINDSVSLVGPILDMAKLESKSSQDFDELLETEDFETISDQLYETMDNNPALAEIIDDAVIEVIAEKLPDDILNDSESLNSIATVLNTVNAENGSLSEILKKEGYELPESTYKILDEFVDRNFPGTDWDANKVSEVIKSFKGGNN